MKKSLAVLIAAFTLGSASLAWAESWTCSYKGSYKNTSAGTSGDFTWAVKRTKVGEDWKMTGSFDDKWGHSVFDGTCSKGVCNFTQQYPSGELKGKTYYWTGKYTDNSAGKDTTVDTITGTWGHSAAHPDDGGPWSATATCAKDK